MRKEKNTDILICENCILRDTAHRRIESSENKQTIKEILKEQGYKCALTGKKLILGETASLDHVVPTSKGETNEKSNLRWTTRYANMAKSDLLNEEFINLCEDVVFYNKSKIIKNPNWQNITNPYNSDLFYF